MIKRKEEKPAFLNLKFKKNVSSITMSKFFFIVALVSNANLQKDDI